MTRWTIREWERIATIPEPAALRLAAAARASTLAGSNGSGVLEHTRKDLRARGVVGMVSASGCQLEILPKIEGGDEAALPEDATLRRRLVHMLAIARDLPIDAGALAHLGRQHETILEILIRLFCNRLADAVRHGLPRRYIGAEEDLPVLRGRLDVTRQFSVLAASPQHLACRFDMLSPDIPLNQAMKAAVTRLAGIAQAPDNQTALRALTFCYADIADIPPAAVRWDAIVLDRTNERWRSLVALARLLLGDRHQDTSSGPTEGHALLFDMNKLFEEFIARLLRRAVAGRGSRVIVQGGHKNCLYDGEKGLFRTRPDIIIRNADGVRLIIDTKWKAIASQIDDPKQGVAQADVYQLMAYGQLYDCPHMMLLYPHHRALGPVELCRNLDIAPRDGRSRLSVATVDVTSSIVNISNRLDALVASRTNAT